MADLPINFNAGDPIETASQTNARNNQINKARKSIYAGKSLNFQGLFAESSSSSFGVPFFVDDGNYVAFSNGVADLRAFNAQTLSYETRTITSDWADADTTRGVVKIGDYLYVLLHDSGATVSRVYRYDADDLASGGTLMTHTFMGTNSDCEMSSDGVDLFFTHDAGDDATNDYEILRASISGTTLTEQEVVTCGSTAGDFLDSIGIDATSIYAYNDTTHEMIRFNRSGVEQNSTTLSSSKHSYYGVTDEVLVMYHNIGQSTYRGLRFFIAIPV